MAHAAVGSDDAAAGDLADQPWRRHDVAGKEQREGRHRASASSPPAGLCPVARFRLQAATVAYKLATRSTGCPNCGLRGAALRQPTNLIPGHAGGGRGASSQAPPTHPALAMEGQAHARADRCCPGFHDVRQRRGSKGHPDDLTYVGFTSDWGTGPKVKAAFEADLRLHGRFRGPARRRGAAQSAEARGAASKADLVLGLTQI